jgi:hypothetical protein
LSKINASFKLLSEVFDIPRIKKGFNPTPQEELQRD